MISSLSQHYVQSMCKPVCVCVCVDIGDLVAVAPLNTISRIRKIWISV